MNKLEVKKQKIENEELDCFEIKDPQTEFVFSKKTKIKEIKFSQNVFETSWILEKDAGLECKTILKLQNQKGKITIYSKEKSDCLLKFGIICEGENEFTLENVLEENQIKSVIQCRIIGSDKSKSKILTRGVLQKNTKENEFLEEVKYLSEEENEIICLPELIVDSNDVQANHNFSVGPIEEEELYSLKTKGISEEKARALLKEGFLKSMLL